MTKKQRLKQAEERVRQFLMDNGGVPEGPMWRHSCEELYFLKVRVPDHRAFDLLERATPLIFEIFDENDFMIGLIPLPPDASEGVERQQASAAS